MGETITGQHPGVVLRSQFDRLRALVAIALVAVFGLTVAVGVVATDGDGVASPSAAERIESPRGPLPAQLGNTRDEPGTHGPLPARFPTIGAEPGTHGPLPAQLGNAPDDPGSDGPLPARLPNGS
jgi:hypothetical protein